jgi:hypothetical protein
VLHGVRKTSNDQSHLLHTRKCSFLPLLPYFLPFLSYMFYLVVSAKLLDKAAHFGFICDKDRNTTVKLELDQF